MMSMEETILHFGLNLHSRQNADQSEVMKFHLTQAISGSPLRAPVRSVNIIRLTLWPHNGQIITIIEAQPLMKLPSNHCSTHSAKLCRLRLLMIFIGCLSFYVLSELNVWKYLKQRPLMLQAG